MSAQLRHVRSAIAVVDDLNKEGNKMVQQAQAQTDPLPSWNDGPKRAIVDFVARVTRQGGPDFVPRRADRRVRQRRDAVG